MKEQVSNLKAVFFIFGNIDLNKGFLRYDFKKKCKTPENAVMDKCNQGGYAVKKKI